MRPRLLTWCVLAGIFVVHVVATTRVIEPQSLPGPEPFYADDLPLHYARAASIAAELPRTWRLWLYDPGVMAGYPLGATVFDLDNVGTAVAIALLAPLGPAVAFKLFVLTCLLGAPLALWAATRRLGGGPADAAGAAAAAVVVGATSITFRIGMFADFAGCWIAVLVVALAARHFDRPTPTSFLWLATASALGLWVHVLVGVLAIVPCAVLVIGYGLTTPRRTLAHAAGIAAATLVLATPWLLPYLRFTPSLGSDYPSPFFQTGSLATAWALLTSGGGWHLLLLGLGAIGLAALAPRMGRPLVLAYGGWVVVLLLASLQGSRLPWVDRLQPLRFLLPLALVLCPLAGAGAAAVVRAGLGALGAPRGWALPLAPLVFVAHLVLGLGAFAPFPPISHPLPAEGWAFVTWLRDTTGPEARVLLEDRLHVERPRTDRDVPDHPYFGGHLPALLPALTGRELIGGPYAEMPIRPHRADLASGIFFGEPIHAWTSERFAAQLARYNVGWIVAWSTATRAFLRALPDLVEPLGSHTHFHAFRVRQPRSFLLAGAGTVTARPNAITVDGATAGGVVLKYHWYPGLCSDPLLPVTPHEAPDLATPFIAVANGNVARFTIHPARDWRGRCR